MRAQRLMCRADDLITWLFARFYPRSTQRLIARRGGIIEHHRLQRVFGEIGRDKYVKASRERNAATQGGKQ